MSEEDEEPYEQYISWNTEALIDLSKILDLPADTVLIIEQDYDMIIEETLEEMNKRLDNMIVEERKQLDTADFFKYRLENEKIISRTAKNNLEDIVNKLIDLYKEYTKKESFRRSCFCIEGVELVETTEGIPVSTENVAVIRFIYGT